MTRLLLVVLIFFLSNTTSAQVRETSLPPTIEPIYRDYVWDFISRSHGLVTFLDFQYLTIKTTRMEYSEKREGRIGLCTWGMLGITRSRIDIDPTFFNHQSILRQWSLLFHEIGHCVCNENHPDIETPEHWIVRFLNRLHINHRRINQIYLHDGCPRTLMYPYDLSQSCLLAHQDYYVQEMFGHCHPTPHILLRGF